MTNITNISPTANTERINSLDIIRGISVCGILLINIVGFGLLQSYDDPTNNGGATGWNLKVWWANAMFFEGTMRGLFSMLFGAGILLFTSRELQSNAGAVTDLFFRRLLWLVLFGIIHCYLLVWPGDVLYSYGIIGMFAFSFRHLSPKKLIIGTIILLSIATIWTVNDYYKVKRTYDEATVALTKKNRGDSITKEETAAIQKWDAKVGERKPDSTTKANGITAMHKSYWSVVLHKSGENQFMQTTFFYRFNFFDILGMMLLGIAFLKLGILKASRSNSFYLLLALVGYAIGISVNYYEADMLMSKKFSVIALNKSYLTYDVGRMATTCGHVAVIMLFIKSSLLGFLQKAMAAVGQMAFTNYILQTEICNFIFLGYGFSLYGKLQRYELYYIVVSVWMLQLIICPLWLKYFRFGPLEWAWRSLTYWQKQPFKK